jgi:hypothetical protein
MMKTSTAILIAIVLHQRFEYIFTVSSTKSLQRGLQAGGYVAFVNPLLQSAVACDALPWSVVIEHLRKDRKNGVKGVKMPKLQGICFRSITSSRPRPWISEPLSQPPSILRKLRFSSDTFQVGRRQPATANIAARNALAVPDFSMQGWIGQPLIRLRGLATTAGAISSADSA